MSFFWTCPYCDRDTTITDTYSTNAFDLRLKNAEGCRRFKTFLIVCPNPKCQRFTLRITVHKAEFSSTGLDRIEDLPVETWNLIPPSSAKVFPDYVPRVIRDDYVEACKISGLSPKASATLSRRCLQGMIRDYWKIAEARLIDEIKTLENKVDAQTWAAIDAIRKIGNIGAHMEKDINVIVDVDPNEAQVLIELIELLLKDWYVARHDREERLKNIVKIKDQKDAAKASASAPPKVP